MISAAISVALVPTSASIMPMGLVPVRNPIRLEKKHPKVIPQIPSGEKSGRRVNASLILNWTVPNERGAMTRVSTV